MLPCKALQRAGEETFASSVSDCFAPGPNLRNGSEKPGAESGRIAAVVSWMNSTSLLSLSGEKTSSRPC
jgi:hypothetical protein